MDVTMNNGPQSKSQSLSIIAFRLLVVVFWSQFTIVNFVEVIIRRLPIIGAFSQYLVTGCVIILIALSSPWILKHIRAVDVIFYLICFAVVFGTMLLVYNNSTYIEEELWRIVGLTIPMFFIGLSYCHEHSKKDLYLVSLVGTVLIFMYQIYNLSVGRETITDNMDPAYKVLPSVMYLIYWALEQKKLKFWLIGVAAVIMMFLFGTRGPVLASLVFLLLGIFFTIIMQKSQLAKAFYLVVFVVVIIIVSSQDFLLNAAEFLSEKFEDIGFSTRVFDQFIEGEIAESKGRETLYSQIIIAIKERPILGYGLMGDRPIIGFYVHNLFLELWCHFGVILGSVIILAIICIPVVALIKVRKSDEFGFVLMLSCLVFTKLMFSSTYLVEPYLFILLGVSIKIIREMQNGKVLHL